MTLQELNDLLQLNTGPNGDRLNFESLKQALSNIISQGASGYNYIEVNVSSSEFLNCGDNPIELLPAPLNPNSYYDFYMNMEYEGGSSGYTFASGLVIRHGATQAAMISPSSFGKNVRWGIPIRPFLSTDVSGTFSLIKPYSPHLNQAVTLGTANLSNPTDGNGSILFKIWFKVRNMGTEL